MKYLRWLYFCILLVAVFLLAPKNTLATNYDLATTANWNVRFDGAAASDFFGLYGLTIADVNNNGSVDLVIGAPGTDYNSRSASGSIYIIYDDLFSSISGTGNTVDMADSTKWNIRIDAQAASDFGSNAGATGKVTVGDIDGDTKNDLVIGANGADNNSRSASGSVWIIYGTILDDYSGTGNTLDLADTNDFNIRYDGPAASAALSGFEPSVLGDINGDGGDDLVMGARGAGTNGSNSGALYIVDNDLMTALTGVGNTVDLATSTSYTTRVDGPAALYTFGSNVLLVDMIGSSELDLVAGCIGCDFNSRTNSGSVYIIPNSIINLAGTGNTVNTGTSTNFFLRVDGPTASIQWPNSGGMSVADLDNDGKNDLIVSSQLITSSTGASYIFFNTLIDDYTGTGNSIDVATASNYNLLITGPATSSSFTNFGATALDFFNTGRYDYIAGSSHADNNSRTDSGSVYLVSNSIISSYAGTTGNSISVSSSSNYTHRYDSALAGDRLTLMGFNNESINSDGSKDIFLSAYFTDANTRTDSGSVYIIYNFPHTITINNSTPPPADTAFTVTGSISASNSVTTISGVEYRVDDNTVTASWTACSADDGTFDSTSEVYTCSVPGLSENPHVVYVRAYDSNGAYSAQSNYGAFSFQIRPQLTAPSTPGGDPYIAPAESPSVESGGGGTISSSPDSSVIISEGSVPFALDVSDTSISSYTPPFGLKPARCSIGDIHEIWLTDFYNKARILPKLQLKPSIIALRYNPFQLLTAGGGMISERSLRLAYSSDGTRWTILPTSVVDTVNNTVAALHKIGGYYMIVSNCGGIFSNKVAVHGVSTRETKDIPLSLENQNSVVPQRSLSSTPGVETSVRSGEEYIEKRSNMQIFFDFINGSIQNLLPDSY